MPLALSISILFILFIQLINGAQFLNVISLSLLSVCFTTTTCATVLPIDGPTSRVIAIFPIASINASL